MNNNELKKSGFVIEEKDRGIKHRRLKFWQWRSRQVYNAMRGLGLAGNVQIDQTDEDQETDSEEND